MASLLTDFGESSGKLAELPLTNLIGLLECGRQCMRLHRSHKVRQRKKLFCFTVTGIRQEFLSISVILKCQSKHEAQGKILDIYCMHFVLKLLNAVHDDLPGFCDSSDIRASGKRAD